MITPAEMLKLAEHILDSKAADFDPNTFVDRYETALVELLNPKQAGIAPKQGPAPVPQARVINLMDALRRSIESEQPKKQAAQSKINGVAPGENAPECRDVAPLLHFFAHIRMVGRAGAAPPAH